MSDIFISYGSLDRGRAKLIADALAGQGWSVWWDRMISPGKEFDEVIEGALDSAKCVVVLWSKTSVASSWVKTEAAEAMRRKILVPALIDDVKIPLEFRRLQAADLRQWEGDSSSAELRNLIGSITSLMARQPSSPVPSSESTVSSAAASQHSIVRRLFLERKPVMVIGAISAALGLSVLALWVLKAPKPSLQSASPVSTTTTGGSRASDAATSVADLQITSLSGANSPRPLDGYEIVNASTDAPGTAGHAPVYPRGARITLDLAHNHQSGASITLRGVELNIENSRPGAQKAYAYRAKGDRVIGAGPIKPLIYHIALFGKRVGPAMRVKDSKRGTKATSRSPNFLDTDDQELFQLSTQDDSQSINIDVTAEEAGLYEISFTFTYSVLGQTKQRRSQPPIWIYYDGR